VTSTLDGHEPPPHPCGREPCFSGEESSDRTGPDGDDHRCEPVDYLILVIYFAVVLRIGFLART
jgi:hypothetical protein